MHSSSKSTASPQLLFLMAVACGLCAGCNYINQPLVHSIAHGLRVSEEQAALSVTISQLSYAAGLLLLVPLGDLLERRRLIVTLMGLAAAGLLLCALTDNIVWFWVGSAVAGVFSVAAQVLVPLVTLLVAREHAGRAVGVLMTGLLIGIQSARSVAGLFSATAGWSSVYGFTAALMLLVAAALWFALPAQAATAGAQGGVARYAAGLLSMLQLFVATPRLRSRAWMGALSFASLSVLFSTMALLLGAAPHSLSDLQIGLLSLVGVVSALVAKPVGRLADQGREAVTSLVAALTLVAIWPVVWLSVYSVTAFALGLLVLSVAIAAIHISNQSVIFGLPSQVRSRANAVYMTAYFLGAAGGSAAGVLAWRAGGWMGVCMLGAALAIGSLLATLWDRRLRSA
ncbi:hypothetical protein AAV94_11900 [Lampropedia cohaerens]|uniref:Major facilitator superfamily (MFS) profile domain-containing protein n=1 Tax=Lampropedia cohaerens TaxID=1610491 RepID=A0A0U1PXF2_9BURK|nr:MFS transporter [Lampropedia cohaerens]KKW67212.1 hypothetical protein AAV94_11900 [Lampropedia cohaerens]